MESRKIKRKMSAGLLSFNFDHKERPPLFFAISLAAVTGGLCLGGIVDGSFRRLQSDRDWRDRTLFRAWTFFLLQSSANILLLLMLTRFNANFLPWLQLSMSGALFSVLLFTSQRNLVDNALRVTNL
jgi:hypothetical protein